MKIKEDKYAELQKKVYAEYEKKTLKSKQMHERACNSLHGGVGGDGVYWQPYPLYITHGKGSKVYDVDGNEYIDSRGSFGAALLGYAHPEIIDAVKHELYRGTLLLNLDLVVEAAELIKEVVPCAERIRLRSTGTEVCMATAMVARAFTGKSRIIKFYGSFHGVTPEFMMGWGAHTTDITSAGVLREFVANTVMLPWNDIDAVRQKLDEDKGIGTVITDVIMGSGGIDLPKGNYLRELRELTKERGVILIFDEVLTGFRIALGGSQEYFGVTPDLACFSKALAGGQPFAALAGREDIMSVIGGGTGTAGPSMFLGASRVFQSGTTNENTAGAAGCISSINILKKLKASGEYEKLNERTSRYAREVEALFRQRGIGCYVNTAGSFCRIHFTDEEPTFDVVCGIDKRFIALFAVAILTEGVHLCNIRAGSSFLSFAHTCEDVAQMLNAMNATLDKFKFEEIIK